jgi:hypothetical protein
MSKTITVHNYKIPSNVLTSRNTTTPMSPWIHRSKMSQTNASTNTTTQMLSGIDRS